MTELTPFQQQIAQVVTQIVCFLIFLWILKKYAIGPVVQVLDERRKKISSEFDKISELENRYTSLEKEYQGKLANIEEEARIKMQESITEGRKIAYEITEEARNESKKILERAQRGVQIEINKAKIELKDEVVAMTIAATEKLIHTKLDEKLDRVLVAGFIDEIENRSIETQ